jgi:hypothetical protein
VISAAANREQANIAYTIYPPKMDGPEALRRSVTILDSALRHRMMEAARTAYRAIGGTEAVWGCDANGRPLDPNHPWNGGAGNPAAADGAQATPPPSASRCWCSSRSEAQAG